MAQPYVMDSVKAWYCPTLQSTHNVVEDDALVPTPQLRQTTPGVVECCWYFPTAHVLQESVVDVKNKPALQKIHVA